jgi:ABC-type amino acid transport substrate-binding protein
MPKGFSRSILVLALALFLVGCAAPEPKGIPLVPLRVGVFPHYPPMIFKQNGVLSGAEAEMAVRLAIALGREANLVELGWEQLIPALMERKIDIIMSGMSITEARKARVRFTEPYLKTGLATLMRAEDAPKYNSLSAIRESFSTIGVVRGTTGEAFVRKNLLKAANVISFEKASDARYLLVNMRIDLFVHDAPSIVWLVSENEGVLKGFWEPFNEEQLGWAVNIGDQEFLRDVNSVLAKWKQDGTLRATLIRWLPYFKSF